MQTRRLISRLALIWLYIRLLFYVFWKPKRVKDAVSLPASQTFLILPLSLTKLTSYCMTIRHHGVGSCRTETVGSGTVENVSTMFFITEAFQCVMECLTRLPFSVLGGILNKAAVHTRYDFKPLNLQPDDLLLHSARLAKETRITPGGHLEFYVQVTTTHVASGALMYEALLTFVKLNSKPGRKSSDVSAAAAARQESAPEEEPAGVAHHDRPVLLDTVSTVNMDSSLGKRWAVLDGDISPMHWSALLSGMGGVVANVNCLLAVLEQQLVEAGRLPSEGLMRVEVKYRKPCVLPCELDILAEPPSETKARQITDPDVPNSIQGIRPFGASTSFSGEHVADLGSSKFARKAASSRCVPFQVVSKRKAKSAVVAEGAVYVAE